MNFDEKNKDAIDEIIDILIKHKYDIMTAEGVLRTVMQKIRQLCRTWPAWLQRGRANRLRKNYPAWCLRLRPHVCCPFQKIQHRGRHIRIIKQKQKCPLKTVLWGSFKTAHLAVAKPFPRASGRGIYWRRLWPGVFWYHADALVKVFATATALLRAQWYIFTVDISAFVQLWIGLPLCRISWVGGGALRKPRCGRALPLYCDCW